MCMKTDREVRGEERARRNGTKKSGLRRERHQNAREQATNAAAGSLMSWRRMTVWEATRREYEEGCRREEQMKERSEDEIEESAIR